VGVYVRIRDRFRPVLGSVLCAALSAAVSFLGRSQTGKSALPIWFLAVVTVIVFRFGSLAGVLGTILSAMIFAAYLFEPLGRLAVHNTDQKNNLMWMVLVGLAISMFGQPQAKKPLSPEENTEK